MKIPLIFLYLLFQFLTGYVPLIGFQGLKNGDISLVIGTHSLIADKVEFSSLRIAVIDEQHRFGVIQRGLFNSKVVFAEKSILPINDEISSSHLACI